MKTCSIPRQARACSELVESDGEQTCLERSRKSRTILALAIMVLWMGSADAKYSGGTGEPNDPYRIATPQDLNDIGNHQED